MFRLFRTLLSRHRGNKVVLARHRHPTDERRKWREPAELTNTANIRSFLPEEKIEGLQQEWKSENILIQEKPQETPFSPLDDTEI